MEYSKYSLHGVGEEGIDSMVFLNVCQDWCRQVKQKITSYPTSENVQLALLQTLIFGRQGYQSIEETHRVGFQMWMDIMLYPKSRNSCWASIAQEMSWDEHNFALNMITWALEVQGPQTANMVIVHCLVYDKTRYHSFSILDSGYMCLNLLQSHPGDQVFLIPGSDWPLVLRPEGDSYRFVGPAYVHGIMNGEGWDKAGPLKKITLI